MKKKNNEPLIPHNEISKDTKHTFIARLITSLVLIFVCIPCIFLGSWFYLILVAVAVGFSAYEIVKASSPIARYKIALYIITFLFLYAMVFWIFIVNNIRVYQSFIDAGNISYFLEHLLDNGFDTIQISATGVALMALVYFFMSFLDDRYTIGHVFYYFGMVVFVGICFQSLLYLRYSPYDMFRSIGYEVNTPTFNYYQSASLLFYVIIGVCINDIFAYLTGVVWGKHKINPRISPKKTWEGLIGGYVISFVFSLSYAYINAACGLPILPVLDLEHWYWILLISLFMPFIAIIGDFIFSSIKRYFAIKDFGVLLKGHGGVLDRLDSILFTSVFVAAIVISINNGGNLFAP